MDHALNFIPVQFLLVLSVDLAYHHRSITLNSEAVKAHRPFWTIQQQKQHLIQHKKPLING
jgi:hypothetical protein